MPPDRDLESELRDLGSRLEYPPVPDLARSVRDRLQAEGEDAGSTARARPQLWWIAAAALVLLVAVPVVTLALRDTGGVSSLGGGAAGGVAESGGPTRLAEDDAAGSTHPSGDDGSLAAGAGGGTPSSGAADSGTSAAAIEDACFPPEPVLEAKPHRGAPGDGFGIRGKNFDGNLRDCDDDPARGVRVEFLQDGRTWELGRFVSDEDSRLAAKLEVPADARPGPATVRTTYGKGAPEGPYGPVSAKARFLVTE
jgi:hypothetical protein